MNITIGGKTYATRRPKDLDKQLQASTGCSAGEIHAMLGQSPLAHLVARALAPFIDPKESPSTSTLATEIAAAGITAAAIEAQKLYVEFESGKPVE